MSSEKLVFTGITGLLGKYFLASKRSYDVIGVTNRNIPGLENCAKVDITNKNLILSFIERISPKIIVHAASIGNVDYCEAHPDEAYGVNVLGTKNVLEGAKRVGAKIIFISSNAVYDGGKFSYNEDSQLNPIDIYGKTKAEGESLVKKSDLNFVILRLMTMYGWPQKGGRGNPVTWVIEQLRNGEKINVVNDVFNNHLWAGQAAKAVWKVVVSDSEDEIYNIAGKNCLNRYELALKVAKVFELNPNLIKAVGSNFFKGIAKRPKNTCFDTSKMKNELGLDPLSIDDGLNFMRKEKND